MNAARLLSPHLFCLALASAWMGGCAVGPDYQRAPAETPAAYREAVPDDHQWQVAEPRPVDLTQAWWVGFDDARLNELVGHANAANQSLRQAEAQYRQSRAPASAADLAAARLTIQGELVQDYIQLRVTDVLKALYAFALPAYEESLKLTQSQFRAGVPTSGDVAPAASVTSAQVKREDVPIGRSGVGTVQAMATVTVKPRVDGQLDRVGFVEGQDV
ncbi:RND efflux system, outer membrane lipoprotein, NodT family [Cupriavidus basilensis]|uniref:RND efflux system, outer membrane lipoprotein, NodT family n=2 Tax=Cupriavidus basilensis TaxID=68895 RepID=A0A0C4Y7V4_9BURK|nr:RND efflux system, outer membrane lipoprotein, NodT family [Cupriavidus basilensis]